MVSILDGLKAAGEVLKEANKIPEYQTIIDAQQKIFDLQNENQELKTKISKYHEKGKMVFAEGQNYMVEDGGDPNRLFCPVCWDGKGIRNPLINDSYCSVCKRDFDK